MAADLAASHLIDFIVFFAPQVGLEPTTLRLTARNVPCPALLTIDLYYLFSGACRIFLVRLDSRDYPLLPAFF